MTDTPSFRLNIKPMKLSELNAAKYNPRVALKAGMPQYEKLKASIVSNDLVEPIIYNKRTKTVVGGHQRLQVMRDIAAESDDKDPLTDVVVIDVPLSREKSLNLSLNKIQGLWDEELLADLLGDMEQDELDLTGFDDFEIMEFTRDIEPTEYDQEEYAPLQEAADDMLKAYNVIISCMNEEDQQWVAKMIHEDGRLKRNYSVAELKERME